MIIYIIIASVVILTIAILFFIHSKKIKVFNKYIDIDISLDFNENTNLKTKGRYGLVLFKINEIRRESRALYIEKVSISNSKIHLRTYNNIYTKLPIPKEGITLSVGVRKSKRLSSREINNCRITLSGFLMDDNNHKLPFKKKLPIYKVNDSVD